MAVSGGCSLLGRRQLLLLWAEGFPGDRGWLASLKLGPDGFLEMQGAAGSREELAGWAGQAEWVLVWAQALRSQTLSSLSLPLVLAKSIPYCFNFRIPTFILPSNAPAMGSGH